MAGRNGAHEPPIRLICSKSTSNPFLPGRMESTNRETVHHQPCLNALPRVGHKLPPWAEMTDGTMPRIFNIIQNISGVPGYESLVSMTPDT